MCDNCQRHFQVDMTDAAAAAQLVVHTLQNLPAADKRLTLTQLIESCRKSKVALRYLLFLATRI